MIDRRPAEIPGDRGDQALDRSRTRGAGVHQDEAAGPDRDLGHARLETRLPEERGVLVPGHGRDGHSRQRGVRSEDRRRDRAEPAARRADVGQDRQRDLEQLAQLGRPATLDDVVEHGPRGIGDVGGEDAAAGSSGEVPEHPCVHRAEGESRIERHPSFTEEPSHLRRREVRVEHQPGPLPDQGKVAFVLERLTVRGGPPVLPHDRPSERTTAPLVPRHDRLALIGHTERGHHKVAVAETAGDLAEGGLHGGPDLVGIVLHPTGLGEVLGELAVGEVDHPRPLVDDERPHPGGAGVDRHRHRCPRGHGWTVPSAARGGPGCGRPRLSGPPERGRRIRQKDR